MLLRGVNDDQAPELLEWCLERGYELRFIEQMPLDAQHGWSRDEMVTADEILAALEQHFVLLPAVEPRGSAPAELFLVDGGPATVGIIASVTRPFCGACDRVRLTADGQIRNCLFAREESDLRLAMRAGATDEELAERWVARCRPRSRATASTTRRSSSRTVRCRRSAAERSRPLSTRPPGRLDGVVGSVDVLRRRPGGSRGRRGSPTARLWSSQASQTLRRSGVWIFGLFHSSAHAAGDVQPLAEQMSVIVLAPPEM